MPVGLCSRLILGVTVLLASSPALAGKGRVALHPVVVIGGTVPDSAAATMTEALRDELKSVDLESIIIQDTADRRPEPAVEAPTRNYAAADAKLTAGRKALQKLQLPKAITALEGAVAGFEGNDAKAADAALLLAEAHYRRGDDAKGRKALEIVARAAPKTRLDANKYPPVFISAFKEVRSRVAKEPKAATPVVAAPGTNLRVGIAANQCDPSMRARAVSLGRSASAELVVLLGIASGERFYTVGGFVGDVRTDRWAPLPEVKLDSAMLSASIEGGKLARELSGLARKFVPVKLEGTLAFVSDVVPPSGTLIGAAAISGGLVAPPPPPVAVASLAPVDRQPTLQPTADELARDTALAADLAALDGYNAAPAPMDAPLETTSEVKSEGGILTKWWFWTAVGVGAAAIGGTAYLLMSRDNPSNTLSMQAAW